MMSYHFARGDALHLPLADQSVDLVMGSPPYMDARTYGIGAKRKTREWVDWMLGVTSESLRVSRGMVLWVVGGVTRDHTYQPGCEGLLWEWQQRGGSCWRPCYWHRTGIPGSGCEQWFRSDVEYVLAFKRDGLLPYADNLAMGAPPKFKPGGKMTTRRADGKRDNKAFTVKRAFNTTRRRPDGSRDIRPDREGPDICNPGNLIHVEDEVGEMVPSFNVQSRRGKSGM